ncbi:MAG: uroporphyrinogen decarboxylase family protein [Planctomycetota bacterium]|jgi:hypothetical protein|nr:uroporphyrinogen decarboxylase family protein [Planctomycetota bacterium]MDP7132607.1 uroporphyrinogen decarboxylase family protein [Planctomycetota bacterium]MDP7251229.1 uroporphyrinogen decarboxylase family protein [Planctomycetota bacterium]
MSRPQPFSFGLADSLLAEVGETPLDALHGDVDAICHCYDMIRPVADRLGIDHPRPRLAGFSYSHLSALGGEIVFAAGSEPNIIPCVRSLKDIDELAEPDDYLKCGVVPERLQTLDRLLARRPDAVPGIGHQYEGPVTTAALLMGQDFFMLPHDDPERAHRLLSFGVQSALNYSLAIRQHFGQPIGPRPVGIPDDFAGMFSPPMFAEFVVPYLEQMYAGQQATVRNLHSELLRVDHLPFLKELDIAVFDPSADQYLTPELLSEHCPVRFTGRLQRWHVRHNSAIQLQEMYRHIASFEPVSISFYLGSLEEEPKIAALLEVARELAAEP